MDPLGLLLIFSARILDVTCGTFRILLLVRGKRVQAAFLGFCEVSIYMIVLGHVLGGGALEVSQLIAYAGGYAAGNFIGAFLEEKLLNGYVMLEIIAERREGAQYLVDSLRMEGFGATVLNGKGKNGIRQIIKVVSRRKDMHKLSKIIGDNSCVFMSDVKSCWGGQFPVSKKLVFKH